MRRFLAAVGFLTIVPIPAGAPVNRDDHGGSVIFYPLVGLLIGLALAELAAVMNVFLPGMVSASLMTLAMVMVSGGLHIDGLSDTFDGFMSSRSAPEILEIMKDSRCGPMGAMAVTGVLIIKFAALASMNAQVVWTGLLLAPLTARCATVGLIKALPYVRSSGGLGEAFCGRVTGRGAVLSALFALVLCVITAGWAGVTIWLSSLVVTLLFAFYSYRRIGGMTGDTYGAALEIAEAGTLVATAACIG